MRLKQIIREYFTFSRTEKRGLWLLGIALLLSAAAPPIFRALVGSEPEPLHIQTISSKNTGADKPDSLAQEVVLQSFDPNTVSRDDLKAMGISDFVVNNWMKYREAGGKFYYRDDVLALYGMEKEMYLSLRKYIDIPKPKWQDYSKEKEAFALAEPIDINNATAEELQELRGIGPVYSERIVKYRDVVQGFDSVQQLSEVYGLEEEMLDEIKEWLAVGPKPEFEEGDRQVEAEDLPPPAIIDLNTADSATLVSLRGIGPVFTRRIMEYRDALGGFHSKDQLLEVYGFPPETYESLEERLIVNGTTIRKLNINQTPSTSLSEHPYISSALANFIVSYRMNHNGFTSLEELKESFLVDEALFRKLSNYLSL